jgi:hypothetical protein
MGVTHVHRVHSPLPDVPDHGVTHQAVLDPSFARWLCGSTGCTRA